MLKINEKIEEFLERNKGMIIKIARKCLGPSFNEKEAISIAYLAALQAKVYKRDQFRKTKDTTVFVWYLQKGFDTIRGFDGGETLNKLSEAAYNGQSRAVDFERILYSASDEAARYGAGCDSCPGMFGMEPSTAETSEFRICIESFRDKAISKKVLDTLRLLTHKRSCSSVIDELENMYGCKRKTALSSKIFNELISEISDAGLKLFKAECLNNVHSIVIACAESREQADNYFAHYGKILRCSQLILM